MVTDDIKNIGRYLPERYRADIMAWIKTVNKDTPTGDYEIAGKDVYARVLSYTTKPIESCRIEAHNRYVDIQSTISGLEGIQVYHRELLELEERYSEETDVEFYLPSCEPFARLNIEEGKFAMLFSYEAHQPEISYSRVCLQIKKFVIKIREELYE